MHLLPVAVVSNIPDKVQGCTLDTTDSFNLSTAAGSMPHI